ncbi:MAG: hypothetical protein EBZ49_04520 [Proteobacteria bacterium]|nr:hypothetical protein [Pseudomonadota bacterium]
MNNYRFYDIVVEDEHGYEMPLWHEFVLELPNHNDTNAMERQEFLGIQLDAVTAASGLNVCSFRSEPVRLNTCGDY